MRTARWFGALTVLVLTVVVAGCATSSGPGSGDLSAGTPTPSGSGPAGSPSPTGGASPQQNPPAPAPAPVRVVISRTGGFAGVQETITIEPNGNWVYNNAKGSTADRGTLSASQRANLLRLLSDPRFATEIRKPNTAVCNDAFEYMIQVGEMTASFEDCADRPAVAAVLTAISQATPF
jgi:hypothetical protein